MADREVLHDLSSLGEEVEVLLDINDITESGHWVTNDVLESNNVLKGFFIKALLHGLWDLSFVEVLIESGVESLDTRCVPEGILLNF